MTGKIVNVSTMSFLNGKTWIDNIANQLGAVVVRDIMSVLSFCLMWSDYFD